jgi:hypothetical protein
MYMAASRAVAAIGLGGSSSAGLRPEPQGVRTQAAGAAYQGIGAVARNCGGLGKSVFRRHSTQSSIATRLRRRMRKFSGLLVDGPVYTNAASVYNSWLVDAQVYEYAWLAPYTAAALYQLVGAQPALSR